MIAWSPHGQARTTYAANYASFGYTALGDSITAYNPSGDPSISGYVGTYADHVRAKLGVPVSLTDLGLPGYTSGGLAYKLRFDPAFQQSVTNANLVTVMIGINDYALAAGRYLLGSCGGAVNQDCIRATESSFAANFTDIILQIKSLANPNVVIFTSDVYNPSISAETASGSSAVLLPFLNQIDSNIHAISAANGLGVAGVYSAFNGATGLEDPIAKGYLVADRFHPSTLGYQVIATQFGNLDSILLNADTDGNGFSNRLKMYLGTDILSSCPQNSSDPAFPPDANNDGHVGLIDLMIVLRAFGKDSTSLGWASTYKRFDFHLDGTITLFDVMTVVRYLGRSGC